MEDAGAPDPGGWGDPSSPSDTGFQSDFGFRDLLATVEDRIDRAARVDREAERGFAMSRGTFPSFYGNAPMTATERFLDRMKERVIRNAPKALATGLSSYFGIPMAPLQPAISVANLGILAARNAPPEEIDRAAFGSFPFGAAAQRLSQFGTGVLDPTARKLGAKGGPQPGSGQQSSRGETGEPTGPDEVGSRAEEMAQIQEETERRMSDDTPDPELLRIARSSIRDWPSIVRFR